MNEVRCYFCNTHLQKESLEEHSSTCAYVLEPCPNKCGAYIQRRSRRNHLQKCRNTRLRARSTENLLSTSGYDTFPRAGPPSTYPSYNPNATIPREYKLINYSPQANRKLSSTYQSNAYPDNPTYDYPHPSCTYKLVPAENDCIGNTINSMAMMEKQQQIKTRQVDATLNKLTADVKLVQTQNKTIVEWRNNVQRQLDTIAQEVTAISNSTEQAEFSKRLYQDLSQQIRQLRNNLNNQQLTMKTIQIDAAQVRNEFEFQLKECEKSLNAELKNNSVANVDQLGKINNLTMLLEEHKIINGELKKRVDELCQEGKMLREQCINIADVNKVQGAQLVELKKALAKNNLNMEVPERSFDNIQGLIATQPGRLVWKISEFDLQMQSARENEKVPLRSPVFYTGDYGYKVRLLVHLNGMKKWRGRHLLAGLHVMKGNYDDLLKWPCKIEANVILRDVGGSEKKDFIRYITAKRRYSEDTADDPQESSTEYIFIPHTTLLKPNHMKNNAIFLEIVVNNTK